MNDVNLLNRLHDLPRPYDAEAVARGLAQWRTTPQAALANDPAGEKLLAALFGNSPYLSQIALEDPDYLAEIVAEPPESSLARLFAATRADAASASRTADLFRPFRRAKARLALLTAVADIGGAWPLQAVTGALSDFAELVLQLGVAQLLREAAAAGEIELPDPANDPARGSGLAIIAMGKLGARELNYSSDIDLMIFFDQEVTRYTGRKTARDCFIRLVQQLVRLMQERTGDGYVFRTDLRLRPDPASTPVVISMAAAEHYYESLGQNWERAAMIKARCLAGDIPAGEAFLSRIGPFIWRKHLDFAAIEDIHSIKRQI
ncbi:MAG: bifunctional [glutamine synthetase] adenylyltransferase/[glutamine synthetase]-adenylyl-L-tyrosine phosphorylase, partial [Ferrovibrionaceae bacterium]